MEPQPGQIIIICWVGKGDGIMIRASAGPILRTKELGYIQVERGSVRNRSKLWPGQVQKACTVAGCS